MRTCLLMIACLAAGGCGPEYPVYPESEPMGACSYLYGVGDDWERKCKVGPREWCEACEYEPNGINGKAKNDCLFQGPSTTCD